MKMVTCKLREKTYHVDFISGRALREIESAARMYAKMVRLSEMAAKGEEIQADDQFSIAEAMDVMIS